MGLRSNSKDESNRHQRRRHKEKTRNQSISPPSYSVVETPDGNLFNPTLNVQWPERPKAGFHSVDEYLKRRGKEGATKLPTPKDNVISEESRVSMSDALDSDKPSANGGAKTNTKVKKDPDEVCEVDEFTERSERIEFVEKQEREKKAQRQERKKKVKESMPLYEIVGADTLPSVDKAERRHRRRSSKSSGTSTLTSFSTAPTVDQGSSLPVPPELEPHFVGVHKEHAIRTFLRPTHFVLYYKRLSISTLDDIPLLLPLTMGYMSNRGIVYHFPLRIDVHENGKSYWFVDLSSHTKNKQPCFLSMNALISFYVDFASLKENGDIEIFPVSDIE